MNARPNVSETEAVEAAACYHAAEQALGAYRPDPAAGSEALFWPGLPGVAFGPHPAEERRLRSLRYEVVRAAFALEEALFTYCEPVEFGWWEYRIDFESGRAVSRRTNG